MPTPNASTGPSPVGSTTTSSSNHDSAAVASRSEPRRRATIIRAITRFFSHYAIFSGRASRSEYWWIALLAALGQSIALIVYTGYIQSLNIITGCGNGYGCPSITANNSIVTSYLTFLIVVGLLAVALVVPALALTCRRLHDSNRSGHFLWLTLIPIFGPLVVSILALACPNPAGQRFDRT